MVRSDQPRHRRGPASHLARADVRSASAACRNGVGGPRRVVAAVLTGLVLFSASSCGDASEPAAPTTTARGTSTTRTPTSTVVAVPQTATTTTALASAPEADAFAAYVSAMQAFDHALTDPPNPDDPLLAQTMVDPFLTQASKLASEWKGFGQAGKFPPDSIHRIRMIAASVDGDHAEVEACSVDDGIVYEPATGKVLNDKVTTARDKATLSRVDGVWKLAIREQLEKWEGVAGCALATS